jgi:hypothetical protein
MKTSTLSMPRTLSNQSGARTLVENNIFIGGSHPLAPRLYCIARENVTNEKYSVRHTQKCKSSNRIVDKLWQNRSCCNIHPSV